ncbi:MAG: tryptophan 2,3-dioxygenase family protein [Planctomycetota bacterium]|nr:tryptophan 2,3-dioxygenase family protein [Planctomycetota bacterium]
MRAPNYWEYIRIEELLGLQGGLEGDESQLGNDEVLFITVHQVYELWFKLILREMGSLRDLFRSDPVAEQELSSSVRSIKRVVVLMRRCVDHFEVMETLSTREYLAFRDKLTPASGFQCAQMRQIEILMGLRDEDRIPLGVGESYEEALRAHDGSFSPALRRVRAQKEDRPTLVDAVESWIFRTPIDGSPPGDEDAEATLDRFVETYAEAQGAEIDRTCELALARAMTEEDKQALRDRYAKEKQSIGAFLDPTEERGGARRRRIRAAMLFILSYRELPLLAWPREVLDGLIELEQTFLIFRQRHARMVERVIGRRVGTGGSAGVEYLDQTALSYRVFHDLWAVRTFQIRAEAIPPLENAQYYAFRSG